MGEHEFETVASQSVYSGKILALRTDEVAMPGGGTAIREVVEHFGAVAVVALDHTRRLAMIYQYRHPLGRRLWELPAGLLDDLSEDPWAAAARELREEAGLAAERWSVLVDVASSPGFSDESVRIYLAQELSHIQRPKADHEEADLSLHWIEIEHARTRVLAGEIVNSIAAVGILSAYAVVVDGQPTRPPDAPWPDRPTAFAGRLERR